MYFSIPICRVSVFKPGPLQWICRELVQKLGSDEATACFGGWKILRTEQPNVPRRKDTSPEDGNSQLLSHPRSLPHFSGPSCFPFLWMIFVVIYPSLPFILLLHLSVIHAHTWVHVLSATLSSVLWAAMAPIALSRGPIHINGVKVVAMGI